MTTDLGAEPLFSPFDAWDPLHEPSWPNEHWSTANVGEALPGVLTPLGWTLWGPTIERAMRQTMVNMGALTKPEAELPTEFEGRIIRMFYGRGALSVDLLARLGDCMPGTTGQQVVAGVYGEVPDTITFQPTFKRLPIISVGLPKEHFTISKKLQAAVAETGAWWQEQAERVPGLDYADAIAAWHDAVRRFNYNVLLQATALFCAVQPMFDALTRLSAKTGVGDATALSGGYGDVPETRVVADLWRCSRGEIDLAEVVRHHGYHGPLEGEISARVWREDDTPLRRMVEGYTAMPDSSDPRLREGVLRAERETLERQLLAELPRPLRPVVKGVFTRAAHCIPLRGVAKGAFLQAFDICRAASRRAGECLAKEGKLDDPEDVFYLRDDEFTAPVLPGDIKETVILRRNRRAEYEKYRLPSHWRGMPVPIPIGEGEATGGESGEAAIIPGLGVSPGVVEGTARVVTDPGFADVESGEILVSPTTDPSWSSIMFISVALVVDIGGFLSHAAIVARELGIPCVVNTMHGSRTIKTGDRIRVDGTAGTVEILERAGS
jgi:phosphohistidine swiveling domain-containing protein